MILDSGLLIETSSVKLYVTVVFGYVFFFGTNLFSVVRECLIVQVILVTLNWPNLFFISVCFSKSSGVAVFC